MKLPKDIIPYSRGILWASRITTTHMSKLLNVSHDSLTRSLKQKIRWKLFFKDFLKMFPLSEGYLTVDESEIDKSFSKNIQGTSWIYSHLKSGFIFGLQIVLICWSNGKIKVPIAWKIYKKNHKTKTELAIELLEYALTIVPNPQAILFDSFYSSEKILKFISRKNLVFYSQVAKNRCLNDVQVKRISNRKYWEKTGNLRGNILVRVARNREKFFITNDLSKNRKEICRIYSNRWRIEEIFRYIKTDLNVEKCQMRDLRSQHNNLGVCLYLFCLLQDTAEETQMTEYAVREQLLIKRSFTCFPALKALLM